MDKTTDEPSSIVVADELPLHPVIASAGPAAATRFLEFFAVTLRNPNTRAAYVRAMALFLDWCLEHGLELVAVAPMHVAAYVEDLTRRRAASTVKLHLAAIRNAFGWLVTGGILPFNPAADVRGPASKATSGKTPVLFEEDARSLLLAIDTSHVVGLRDRALIGIMLYSFARVSAVVGMRVRDYETLGRRAHFVLQEKGGKFQRVPAHHKAAQYVEEYLEAAGIADDRNAPLFRTSRGHSRKLTDRPMRRLDALAMVKRRAADAGFPPDAVVNHTFRATGITAYMQNGGDLKIAAQIAGHASTRTTQVYDRNPQRLELAEIERIRI